MVIGPCWYRPDAEAGDQRDGCADEVRSALVDIAIDQGGCRGQPSTTYDNPTFTVHTRRSTA